jgi:hypothetical protein
MTKNPHVTASSSLQQRFSMSVLAGITDGYLMRLHVLEDCFDVEHYASFLEELPPYLFDDVPFFQSELEYVVLT